MKGICKPMEILEVIVVFAFSLCVTGVGGYICMKYMKRPTIKQSPSLENLVIEDPQPNDLVVGSGK
jgi:hypothetical protein